MRFAIIVLENKLVFLLTKKLLIGFETNCVFYQNVTILCQLY